ncbi:hypothetical protein N0V90_006496 [Kalmusia sp. IMI 367209]|nr:hypothetical protein N0V90_006496 [Kalmusia sp. IMI 367209]
MPPYTIAVAGGTGGIGRALVAGLVEQSKHKILVLSRNVHAPPTPPNLTHILPRSTSIPTIATSYDSVATLKNTLQEHGVDIVVSALILATPENSQAQLNLIEAAVQSGTVKKFIPSEYGIHYTEEVATFHPAARYWLDAAAALRTSHLHFTRIVFGWTLDHYGLPRVHSYMKPFRYVLDFDARRAAVPGDGTQPVSFLHTADLARYVGAVVDGEGAWPEGVDAGEKWTVTYDSIETLEKGEATMLPQPEGAPTEAEYPGMREMISEFGLMATRGVLDVSGVGVRNGEFPWIKPMSVEEVVEKAWGKGVGLKGGGCEVGDNSTRIK